MIAIVLVNYNNKIDTIDCLKSIYKSSEIELPYVVIVDNNSSEILHEIDLNFYPNLKIIHQQENMGFGKANNIGIDWILKNLDTNYIFLLNNDTEVEPNSLIELVNNFPKNNDTIMVSPKILTFEDPPRIWYGGGFFNFNKMSVTINNYGQLDHKLNSGYVDFASGCAMFFKTEYLENNGGFDPNFFMYDEDVDLCIRIKNQGFRIFFTNESSVLHKCQGSQKVNLKKELNQLHPDNPNCKFYLSHTVPNRFYITDKNYNKTDKIKKKIALTSYWLAKALQYLILGRIRMMILTVKLVIKGNTHPKQNIT